ncbi:MAG: SLC13 family permease [Legionellaceae bacterium]|nr:SLC13 family permease [Legionellaceae bacterium]
MILTQYRPYSVIIILLFTMLCFIWRKWPFHITAILALAIATMLGIVPMGQVFSGIYNPAVITVASIMIITSVISDSKVLEILISKLEVFTRSRGLHVFSFSLVTAFLSSFMNNIGALGLMMPVSIATALKNNRSPSYILMPIAMASALGGMITLIGTPSNLIVANFRAQALDKPFGMFDFSCVGLPIALIGVIFIGLIGWRFLPRQKNKSKTAKIAYACEILIHSKSKWIGTSLKYIKNNFDQFIEIKGVVRKNRKVKLSAELEIKSGDHLIIEATIDELQNLFDNREVTVVNSIRKRGKTRLHREYLIEAVIPAQSNIKGKVFDCESFKRIHKFTIIAIYKSSKTEVKHIKNMALQPGDLVVIQYKNPSIIDKLDRLGLIPLKHTTTQVRAGITAFFPLMIFALMILLVTCSVLPVEIGFTAAAILMMIFDSSVVRNIQERFDWPMIIFLAAMIPIGNAFTQTGGALLITDFILGLSHQLPTPLIIGLLMLITMILSDFINNAATAIVMAPIAISLGQVMNMSVDALLMAVAIGASCAFLTPIGHQNNLLVMGPGKYNFFDYGRIGLPLELIILFVATPLIYWIW